jgi:hypothetical protein
MTNLILALLLNWSNPTFQIIQTNESNQPYNPCKLAEFTPTEVAAGFCRAIPLELPNNCTQSSNNGNNTTSSGTGLSQVPTIPPGYRRAGVRRNHQTRYP